MLQIKNEQKIKKYLFVYPVLSSTNKTTDIQIREVVKNETSKISSDITINIKVIRKK